MHAGQPPGCKLSERQLVTNDPEEQRRGRGNTVYKIIKVDKIIPSHIASFDNDYSELLNEATMKKQNVAIDEFLDSKLKTTYIVIDPLFKDCEFSREGWNKIARTGVAE